MKKIVLMCLCLATTFSYAQEKPLSFEEVVQGEGKTVNELYTIIKTWVASNFKSANDAIQMDDPENGVLICKGNFAYKAPGGMNYRYIDGHVNFTLKAQVREGRCKITVSDFIHFSEDLQWTKTWSFGLITDREKYKPSGLQDSRWTKTWSDLQAISQKKAQEIIASIKEAISNTTDEW
ncbi:hypothetical protein EZS27_029126 [termite gut metagenome]|uniref:DUF4468 domain-containing protein n=1 Tax=termite gut metagenome TaxID=433724 RepID=A0A5J4QJK8_9ZZZZ